MYGENMDELTNVNKVITESGNTLFWEYEHDFTKWGAQSKIYVLYMLAVYAIIFLGIFIANPHINVFLANLIWLKGLWIGLFILFVICYVLAVLVYGKKYSMAFIMDNTRITSMEKPQSRVKTENVKKIALTIISSFENADPSVSQSIAEYSNEHTSFYNEVNSLKINRKNDCITIISQLQIHMIFVNKSDIDAIWDAICSKCPQAKIVN